MMMYIHNLVRYSNDEFHWTSSSILSAISFAPLFVRWFDRFMCSLLSVRMKIQLKRTTTKRNRVNEDIYLMLTNEKFVENLFSISINVDWVIKSIWIFENNIFQNCICKERRLIKHTMPFWSTDCLCNGRKIFCVFY